MRLDVKEDVKHKCVDWVHPHSKVKLVAIQPL
jgi:hypothetical protein